MDKTRCSDASAQDTEQPSCGESAAVHFVGFRGEEYWSAVRVFGPPDFIHRGWDLRANREIATRDVIVFAREAGPEPSLRSYDDLTEPDDPARREAGRSARDPSADRRVSPRERSNTES